MVSRLKKGIALFLSGSGVGIGVDLMEEDERWGERGSTETNLERSKRWREAAALPHCPWGSGGGKQLTFCQMADNDCWRSENDMVRTSNQCTYLLT